VTVSDDASPPSFQILGPLRAWRGTTELDLGPGKQRAVLAVLLLGANRPMPPTRIVDAVWGDEPPENGVNVVQKYVAGLRRILEPGRSPRSPGQLLTWTEAGYTLNVPPDRLDAGVFRDHVARARSAGRPEDAARHLDAALALWHDDALAGLRGAYFDAARDRLADERAAAVEESARIALDRGDHARLVPELGRLVTEFPLREELRHLYILALYRSGRQAEALAAYQDARRFLAEEFGVEPGERLQRLHLAILRSDRALTPYADGLPEVARPPVTGPAIPGPVPVSEVRRRPLALRALAVALPLVTFGLGTWALIAFLAARRHSRPLALAAAGYFLLIGVLFVCLGTEDSSAWDAVGMLALLASTAGGAAHTAVLVSQPRRSVPPDATTVRALELRIRREQALTLLEHHPRIARELHIGRPDLSRMFDDGGLIDVNGVPEHVLAALPGVTVSQARQIVERRRATGGFTSVRDLVAHGLLPAPVVRALSDVLVAIEDPAPAVAGPDGLALPG
jgi:DNA-binding SARP family transcriptional activator